MEDQEETEVRRETTFEDGERVDRERVRTTGTVSGMTLVERLVYYIGGALLILLGIRFLLLLFGASRSSGFVDFIYSLSAPFTAPFNGIFSEPTYGSARFDTSTLVAIIVYAIVMVGIAKLLTIGRRNP